MTIGGDPTGVLVAGEFLSLSQGKPWTDDKNEVHTPVNATVLVGDRTIRVEFQTADDAEAAVGQTQRGERLVLPVFVQSPKGTTFVFYRGRRAR